MMNPSEPHASPAVSLSPRKTRGDRRERGGGVGPSAAPDRRGKSRGVPVSPVLVPQGHQASAAALINLDELIVSHPLATLRGLASRSGLSRDTVQNRKKALVWAGILLALSYEELRQARNHDRFEKLGLQPAPRRNRQNERPFV